MKCKHQWILSAECMLCEEVVSLRWTTEKPTKPGFYWLRPKNKPPRTVRVTEKTIASMYGIGGEWAGPLEPPI